MTTVRTHACLAIAACAVALVATGGCRQGLAGIDARVDELLQRESSRMGGDAYGPSYTPTKVQRHLVDENAPPTTNPGAGELAYSVADEQRDVQARLAGYADEDGSPRPLSLGDAFSVAHQTGREFLTAEEDYILAAIRLLIEEHRWGPRLFNDTSVTLSGSGDDGRYESAVRVLNDLRITQRLPYGGTVEARWIWDATEQLRQQATGNYVQSSSLALNAQIPLLRGAGLAARETLIQARRDLVYEARDFERFRRRFLVDVSRDYFSLLQSQAQIVNQEAQIASLERVSVSTSAKVDAGLLREFERNLAENDLLQAQAALESLRENYRLQLDRFKIRLGIPVEEPVEISELEFVLPDPDVSVNDAVGAALAYRLDLQTRRDRVEDRRRDINIAMNQLLPDLNLSGAVTLPTDPDDNVGGLSFDPEELSYSAGITFGLPLDREIERLQLRQATITLEQEKRTYDQFRDQTVLDARASVRAIDLARFQVTLAEQRVAITERRQTEQRIREDETSTQEKLDTENELLRAKNARDRARTDLRNAILDYLLATGQLRVTRDGDFQSLPGMTPE